MLLLRSIRCDPGLLLKCAVETSSQKQQLAQDRACSNGSGSLEQARDFLRVNRVTYFGGHENATLKSPAMGDCHLQLLPLWTQHHTHAKAMLTPSYSKCAEAGSSCEMQDSSKDNFCLKDSL